MTEAVILCGGVKSKRQISKGCKVVSLKVHQPTPNVNLKIRDNNRRLAVNISERQIDLLEIAAYVYAADQSVSRGGENVGDFGESWRRELHFSIPVRDLEFWSKPEIRNTLEETLGFLSDEVFNFEFSHLSKPPLVEEYFDFGTGPESERPKSVMLFSGGLDSLGGLVQEVVEQERSTILVTHKSTGKTYAPVEDLLTAFRYKFGSNLISHVPVLVNKSAALTRGFEQRTRSFLYSALATIVARVFNLDRIKFYENGITSFNLPVADQIIGAKATRTTHPRVMRDFSQLYSLIVEDDFKVLTPFLWEIKEDVVRIIGNNHCEELIPLSNSCTHTYEKSEVHPHCGKCSQCIERRFGVFGAGLEKHDPADKYGVDLLIGGRLDGKDRILVEGYVRRARDLGKMNEAEILGKYPELIRIIPYLDLPSSEAARKSFDLLRRHAEQIGKVIQEGIKSYAKELQQGEVPSSCLLVMAVPGQAQSAPIVKKPEPSPPTFRRLNGVWEMIFAGEIRHIEHLIGFEYISKLLEKQGHEINCLDIIRVLKDSSDIKSISEIGETEDKREGLYIDTELNRGIEAFSDKTDKQLEDELKRLSLEREEAIENFDHKKIAQLDELLDKIKEYRRKGRGKGGRRRRLSSTADKARKSVWSNLENAYARINKYHPALSNHLRDSIRKGSHLCYNPPEPISWILS